MQKNAIEVVIGAVVLLVAGGFLVSAYKGSEMSVSHGAGYTMKARFGNATGINVGSDVRIGGIKVGVVTDMQLDRKTYDAVALFHIQQDTPIPADSSAAIVSSGLLGDKFIQITPGGDDAVIKDKGELKFTQSYVSLEELIGKFMFSGGGVDKNASAASGAGATPH